MKNVLLFTFIILAAACTFAGVLAQNACEEIQDSQTVLHLPCYLIDIKDNKEYPIENWGIISVGGSSYWDEYWNSVGYRSKDSDGQVDADTLVLYINITNTTFLAKNYFEDVKVKAVYNYQYEIYGWGYQLKKDYRWNDTHFDYLSASNIMDIEPFYEGYYRFGVTLPKYIINDNKPLYLEVSMAGVTMTYIVR